MGVAWKEYAREGNLIFFLRIALLALPVLVGAVFAIWVIVYVISSPDPMTIIRHSLFWAFIIAYLLLLIPLMIIHFFVLNFMVPIMYSRRIGLREAATEGWAIVTGHFETVFVFWIMRILLHLAAAMIMGMAGCLSMCLLVGCIPIVGQFFATMLTLPVWVAMMAYSMYFIQQFGYPLIHEPVFAPVSADQFGYAPFPTGWEPTQPPYSPAPPQFPEPPNQPPTP